MRTKFKKGSKASGINTIANVSIAIGSIIMVAMPITEIIVYPTGKNSSYFVSIACVVSGGIATFIAKEIKGEARGLAEKELQNISRD